MGFHLARIQWEKLTVPRKQLCALCQAPGTGEDVTPESAGAWPWALKDDS